MSVAAVVTASLSVAVILVRFLVTFARSRRLIEDSEREALTDTVTALANRRALMHDLRGLLGSVDPDAAHLLAIFDLDGFKQYNDTFGHPAGDMLLVRLSERLRDAAAAHGATAYRIGGDEFCVLGPARPGDGPERLLAWGNAALAERGEGFAVTASGGATESCRATTTDASAALSGADERMYENEALAAQLRAPRRTTAVLRAVQDAVERPQLPRGPHEVRWRCSPPTRWRSTLGLLPQLGGGAGTRLRGGAPRRRQARHPRRDPRQARGARSAESGRSCAVTPSRRSTSAETRLRVLAHRARSSARATSAGTAAAIPTGSRATRSRSARRSCSSATRSTP